MSKKTAGGILGTLIATGVALGVVKYLKDYADVKFTDDSQIDKVKSDSGAVKDAAKRTYIAIKEKSDIKEAASELTKATGSVVTDACDIAKTAGAETVNAFKDMKSRYDEDPEGFKSEVSDNLADMTQGIVKATQDKTEEIVDRIRSAYSDFEEDLDYDDESEAIDDEEADEEQEAAVIGETGVGETAAEASETDEDKEDPVTAGGNSCESVPEEGSFRPDYVDDKEASSNVTITEDEE